VSFDDVEGRAVLRFYFPHPSHTSRTYTAEELALFGRFRERYEGAGGQGPVRKKLRNNFSSS
jgi:hypothetical protein